MPKFLRLVCAMGIAVTLHFTASSQSLSVNTTGNPAAASAILDVESTVKGMLLPRMSKTQKNAIAAPATGLLVYQTTPDSIGFHYYDGTKWVWLSNTGPLMDTINWKTHGNLGLTDATSFFGNIDDVPLSFRINNKRVGRLMPSRWNYSFGAGAGNDLGEGHTAMGDSAAANVTNNQAGVFIGYRSGVRSIGNNNTFVGSWSGEATTTGQGNAFFGTTAGIKNTTGNSNAFLGHFTAYNNTTGAANTAVGTQALYNGDTASFTTFLGTYSGYHNKSDYNTGVGAYSLFYNNFTSGAPTTGIENTGLGYGAGYLVNLGSKNTAVGHQAMRGVSTYISGNRNVAMGDSAMTNLTSGSDNTSVGAMALNANLSGSQHVAVGSRALKNTTATYPNTAIGYSSLDSNTTAGANTAVGSYSLTANKLGINNVAIGNAAMYESPGGSNNTAVGNDAARLINADYNTAVGASALRNDTTGVRNVALGWQSSYLSDSVSSTVALGAQSLYFNRQDSNVAVGYRAGLYLGSGIYGGKEGAMVGNYAGAGAYASSKNTALGFRALAQMDAGGLGWDYTGGTNGRNTAIGDSAMAFSPGISNVAVGVQSLANAGSGSNTVNNVAVGDSAMGNAKSDLASLFENVAVGFKSLTQVRNHGNIAVGAYAGRNLSNAIWNTVVGYHALETATTGSGHTAIGTSSFRNNVTGFDNVGVGINSGIYVTSSYNTYLGSYTGEGTLGFSTGQSNTGVGYLALNDIRSGNENVAIGLNALRLDTSGTGNVAIGPNAMYNNLASDYNVAIGNAALVMHKRAGWNYNVAIGASALEQDSSGYQNTGVGTSAFRNNKTGVLNTGIGMNAGYYHKESYNTFIGAYSGVGERINPSFVTADTGNYNTGLGAYSLWRIANGNDNVALGYNSLAADSSGSSNTAVGSSALSATLSIGNTALGFLAGNTNTTGTGNTLLGYNSDVSAGNLINATAIGINAIVAASNAMVLGQSGTSVGINETTPDARLHIRRNGSSGGTYHGSSSMIIEDNTSSYLQFSNPTTSETGMISGNAITTIRSAVIFRADSSIQVRSGGDFTSMTIDNTGFVGIGNTAPADLLHVGTGTGATIRIGSFESIEDFGANILAVNASFYPTTDGARSLGAAANRWTTVYATVGAINTSDARDKENIIDLNYGLKEVMKLRPVSFNWKENPQWGKKIGFIAQEVQPILGEVVQVGDVKSNTPSKDVDNKAESAASDKLGIYYSDIIPVTVKAIQEQQQQIEDLKKKNEQLEKDIQMLKEKLGIKN